MGAPWCPMHCLGQPASALFVYLTKWRVTFLEYKKTVLLFLDFCQFLSSSFHSCEFKNCSFTGTDFNSSTFEDITIFNCVFFETNLSVVDFKDYTFFNGVKGYNVGLKNMKII